MSEDFLNLEKKPNVDTGREFSVSVLILIVVLLVVGGFVFFREHNGGQMLSKITGVIENKEEKTSLKDTYIIDEKEDNFIIVEETEDINNVAEDKSVLSVITGSENTYTKVVQKGEGLTHIARRVISDYLVENEVEISAEQRIYMEDYIQRRISLNEEDGERIDRWLEVGEEVEVSSELVEEALQKALQLTPQEIENLHPYTLFVYFSS